MGVFTAYEADAYPYWYAGTITNTSKIAGGTPTDSKVAEAWIRAKLGASTEEQIQHLAAQAISERLGGVQLDAGEQEAAEHDIASRINALKNLNGFKRGPQGIFLEGRHLKACLKEAVSCCVAVDKLPKRGWGTTNKGALSFAAEHIIVPELELFISRDGKPLMQADDVDQRFVSTYHGTGIQYEEVVLPGAELSFTVKTDHEYSTRDWAMIWLTAQQQGLGSSRSQGYGVFELIKWERITAPKPRASKPAATSATPARPRRATTTIAAATATTSAARGRKLK